MIIKKKGVYLTRVSTPEQKDSNLSLPAQGHRIDSYGLAKGIDKWKEFEFDESAYKKNRKKFSEVIELIQESEEDVALVCDKIDRLIRNFTKDLAALEELRLSGKLELHFPSDNLILHKNSPAADLFRWGIGIALAKYYSDAISDNVKRAIEQKLRNGEWPGKAPVGYKNINLGNDKTDIISDPDRHLLIIKAFELYASGAFSMFTLRRKLKEEGLTNNTPKKGILSQGQIENILTNPFYYGMMRYRGKLYPHRYQPLISKELFDKAQEVRLSWHKKPFKYKSKPFAYRGLATCAECGCLITPEAAKDKYIYYHCTQYHGKHNAPWLKEDELTKQFKTLLSGLKIPDKVMGMLKESLRNAHESESGYHRNIMQNLERENSKMKTWLETLYQDRLDGRITADEYDDKVKSIKERQDENIEQQRLHSRADETFYLTSSRILELANRAAELFEISEAEEKRRLLQFVLQKTELKGKNLEFTVKKPFDILLESAKTKDWLPG